MGSQIKFTQLYGATSDAPLSSLLELNGFTFLIVCGWTEEFEVALLAPLKQAIPQIDAVLLSHPDTAHLGALPYAIGHLGLKVPIYATQPTCRMGQMFMYDQYLSHHATSDFEHFDLDDVDTAFDYQTVHQLKFQQNMKLTGQLLSHGLIFSSPVAAHSATLRQMSYIPAVHGHSASHLLCRYIIVNYMQLQAMCHNMQVTRLLCADQAKAKDSSSHPLLLGT